MRVWHGYEIDFPKLKDTDMADLQRYTSDLGNALSRELLKFNSQLANMQNDIEDLEAETVQNDSDLEATKQFIENSMKTLSAEGTSIHVSDSADYGCNLRIEGKSEQVQTEQSANLADADVLYKQMEELDNTDLAEIKIDNKNCIKFRNSLYRSSVGFRGLNNIKYKENTQYTIRGLFRLNDVSQLEASLSLYISYSDGSDSFVKPTIRNDWTEFRILTEQNKTPSYISFGYGEGGLWLLDKDSLCIAEGNVTEYPAFIPDSPSPNYRSPIENVSGDLEVKVVAKNLMPSDLEKYTYNNGTYGFFKISGQARVLIMSLTEKNADIDLSGCSFGFTGNGINAEEGFRWLVSNGVVYSNGKINNSRTLGEMMYVSVWPNNQLTLEKIFNRFNIQVEEGDTATEYEPYKEQTVKFPLGEQKLMKDGYLGENGVVNKRKQLTLTGNENWQRQGTTHTNVLNLYLTLESKGANRDNVLCSVAKQSDSCGVNNDSIVDICNLNTTLANFLIDLDLSEFADITAWKTYLAEQYSAGTPVIVEYEMQEEETTAYTSEQQTAYNALQKLKTYRTVTNISNNQDTNMKLTYKMDLQTQIAGGGSSA